MVSETKTTEAPALRRELKARHLTMIAIGGSIGTGLFVASGATISAAGPGGALFSYILIGLMVYFLMTSLGELAAYMPVSGSFATYGQNYVEEGFGLQLPLRQLSSAIDLPGVLSRSCNSRAMSKSKSFLSSGVKLSVKAPLRRRCSL